MTTDQWLNRFYAACWRYFIWLAVIAGGIYVAYAAPLWITLIVCVPWFGLVVLARENIEKGERL